MKAAGTAKGLPPPDARATLSVTTRLCQPAVLSGGHGGLAGRKERSGAGHAHRYKLSGTAVSSAGMQLHCALSGAEYIVRLDSVIVMERGGARPGNTMASCAPRLLLPLLSSPSFVGCTDGGFGGTADEPRRWRVTGQG